MCSSRFIVAVVLACGITVVLTYGIIISTQDKPEKPGKSGVVVLIAGSAKVERGGQNREITIEGKGFKAEWRAGDVNIARPHWEVTFDEPLFETPVVVATAYEDEPFLVAVGRIDRKGFRVTARKSFAFGFTFIVVER